MDPIQGDPSHVYVGRDGRGDVWQLVDDGGNVLEWAVAPGDDSRSMISGTLQNLGPVSPMTVAQVTPPPPPVSSPAPFTPPAISTPVQGDVQHRYVGTDSRGDVWQLFDGTSVIEWAVKVNDDSRNVIPGTIRNLGSPSPMTVAQATPAPVIAPAQTYNPTPVPAQSAPAPVVKPANNSPVGVPGTTGTAYTTPAPAPAAPAGAANPLAPPIQSDPRHVYVGRDSRGDVWQIFDGANVIEWAVPAGHSSGEVINGSLRNIGPPSVMSVAQDDGYRPPSATKNATPVPPAVNSNTQTAAQAAASQSLKPIQNFTPTGAAPAAGTAVATGAAPAAGTAVATGAASQEKSTFLVVAGIAISALQLFK